MNKATNGPSAAQNESANANRSGGAVTIHAGAVARGTEHGSPILSVHSREDFVRFVRTLAEQSRRRPDEWENRDLSSYLEAMAAWVEDMDGYYQNRGEAVPAQPPWNLLRDMLEAAKVYE